MAGRGRAPTAVLVIHDIYDLDVLLSFRSMGGGCQLRVVGVLCGNRIGEYGGVRAWRLCFCFCL